MTAEQLLHAALEREKASRQAAEQLLERSSRELYRRNHELQQSAHLLTEILAAAPDGIVACTSDLRIMMANDMAAQQAGLARRDLVGGAIDALSVEAAHALRSAPIGLFQFDEVQIRRADGGVLPVEIRGRKGEVAADFQYLLVIHDITQRLKTRARREEIERQVDEARRLESIGALSAGIAHEINTPLQFIGDNLEFLEEALAKIHSSWRHYDRLKELALTERRHLDAIGEIDGFNERIGLGQLVGDINAALRESRKGIGHVRDIVRLMKEFAHPGTGASDLVDFNEIAKNVGAICRSRCKGVAELELDLQTDLARVACRRGQMQQVILNIVINAIDAVEETKAADGRILVRTRSDGKSVQLTISDNGPGVPASLRQKIFDPFFTTKPVGKGTGQGLALAKDCVVKGHGGRLTLVDVEGFSTTFLIELPLETRMETENVRAA